MKKGEFIHVSKMMVKESCNRKLEKTQRITINEVEVIGFHENPNGYRLLLQSPTSEGIYYGVSYDKSTDELRSYIYKKVGKRTTGKKHINRKFL